MDVYEQAVLAEVEAWKKKLEKRSGKLSRLSKKAQNKINGIIPDKAHQIMTDSIKNLVQGVLAGSEYMTKEKDISMLTRNGCWRHFSWIGRFPSTTGYQDEIPF